MSMENRLKKLERCAPEPVDRLSEKEVAQRLHAVLHSIAKSFERWSAQEIYDRESGGGDDWSLLLCSLIYVGRREDLLMEQARTLAKVDNRCGKFLRLIMNGMDLRQVSE